MLHERVHVGAGAERALGQQQCALARALQLRRGRRRRGCASEVGPALSNLPPRCCHAASAARSGRALGWGHFGGMATTFFGFNGQPMGAGMVRVGDPAHVLRTTDWAAAA